MTTRNACPSILLVTFGYFLACVGHARKELMVELTKTFLLLCAMLIPFKNTGFRFASAVEGINFLLLHHTAHRGVDSTESRQAINESSLLMAPLLLSTSILSQQFSILDTSHIVNLQPSGRDGNTTAAPRELHESRSRPTPR